MADSLVTQMATVLDEIGLHLRPARLIAEEAEQHRSRVELAYQGQAVDAKSIMQILTLGAGPNACVEVRAEGPDAEQAVAAVVGLFSSNFEADSAAQQQGGAASDVGPAGS